MSARGNATLQNLTPGCHDGGNAFSRLSGGRRAIDVADRCDRCDLLGVAFELPEDAAAASPEGTAT